MASVARYSSVGQRWLRFSQGKGIRVDEQIQKRVRPRNSSGFSFIVEASQIFCTFAENFPLREIGFRYKTPARLKPRSTTVLRVFVLFVCLFLEAWPGVHPRREAAHVLRHPALVGFGGGHQLAASQLVRVSRASAAPMVGRRALVRRRRWRQDAGVATLALEAPVRRCSVMSSSIRHVSGPSDQTIFLGGGGV